MRDRSWNSPPLRGMAAPSSAYESAPQTAANPPRAHASRIAGADWRADSMYPVVVKTPTPIMLAMISREPETTPSVGGGSAGGLVTVGSHGLGISGKGETRCDLGMLFRRYRLSSIPASSEPITPLAPGGETGGGLFPSVMVWNFCQGPNPGRLARDPVEVPTSTVALRETGR